MSTLGLVALVLAALVVALGGWVLRRRSGRFDESSPRTVADLVRLRAEQAGAAEQAGVVEPADPVEQPGPVEQAGPVQQADLVEQTAPVEQAGALPEPGADGSEPDAPPVVSVVGSESQAGPEADRTGDPAGAPAALPASAGDTPWNRAARIAESDGVVWADDRSAADESAAHHSGHPRPEPLLRPVVLPALPPHLVDTRSTVAAPAPARVEASDTDGAGTAANPPIIDPGPPEAPAATAGSEPAAEPAAAPPAEPARARRTRTETAAEQAAADLALLRTFGCTRPGDPDDEPAAVSLEGAGIAAPEPVDGADQPVAFRVVGRDGVGVEGAGVTLLDDRGREAAGAVADADGRGTVRAPHPGAYVLVSAAAGHQPGAVAITVAGEPVDADLLLARSASVAGTVFGEDGPIVGARLTLVQDGEIVDSTGSGPGGEYRFVDLAAGEYGLSVTAPECEPAAALVTVPDETDLGHDVELDPAGLPARADDPAADVMIGHR